MTFNRAVNIGLSACLALLLIGTCLAQASSATSPPDSDPFRLSIGLGASAYTNPHVSISGCGAVPLGSGFYSETCLDESALYNATTQKFSPISVFRTGASHNVYASGPVSVAVLLSMGAAQTQAALTGTIQGGGRVSYARKGWRGAALYGELRLLKPPDPGVSAATVETAYAVGVTIPLSKK